MNENFLENKFSLIPDDFLVTKIKYSLALIGMSESYFSFNYLVEILLRLIKADAGVEESLFKEILEDIASKNNITTRSLRYELIKILNCCTNSEITSKSQYNLKNNGIINKIRVVKEYILHTLNQVV